MKTAALVDLARRVAGIPSDYALAKILAVSRQTVSQWRSGAQYPSNRNCFDLAHLAGRNPAEVIAEIEHEREFRAGRIEAAEGWRNTLQRLAGVAAGLAVVSVCSAPAPASAAGNAAQFGGQPLHIMFNRWRRSLRLAGLVKGPAFNPI